MPDTPPTPPKPTVVAQPDLEPSPGSDKTKLFQAKPESSASSSRPVDTAAANGETKVEPAQDYDVNNDLVPEALPPLLVASPLLREGEAAEEKWWTLKMSWSGKTYELQVEGNDMIYDFRARIYELTNVPPVRQKLIGLTKGKLASDLDSTRFGSLGVKQGCKFTMVGTPEDQSFKDPTPTLAEINDDFDVLYPSRQGAVGIIPADDPRNKRMIQRSIARCPINVMNEPRLGKHLLVLDLDYTLVDSRPLIDGSLPADECLRPGLHAFLEKAYEHYDIVIWSQTSWRWLEGKLVEMGVIGGDSNYKICFVADKTAMFPVFSFKRGGQLYQHEVKPLAYFWANFPQWGPRNTIHVDDLSRNFAMNPGEGLRIRAYKTAGTYEGLLDNQLFKLSIYLSHLAPMSDFTSVDHAKWKQVVSTVRATLRERAVLEHGQILPNPLNATTLLAPNGAANQPAEPTLTANNSDVEMVEAPQEPSATAEATPVQNSQIDGKTQNTTVQPETTDTTPSSEEVNASQSAPTDSSKP